MPSCSSKPPSSAFSTVSGFSGWLLSSGRCLPFSFVSFSKAEARRHTELDWTMKKLIQLAFLSATAWLMSAGGFAFGQVHPDPQGSSIATPRPINPAASTTNPSALATQGQNPYLGSTHAGKVTDEVVSLSLRDAVDRGLRYNLGLIESNQGTAEVRAQRLRALSALLPNLSVRGEQAFEDISLKEIGLKLPPTPGFSGLPATTGPFGYQDARVDLTQSLYSAELHERYAARKSAEQASALATRDARDVVVYAVGIAYLQVVASAARVETSRAQLASAQELDQQTADQVRTEVSPEIDSIRAQVQRQTAEQRLINATDSFEKDKLALGRIIGSSIWPTLRNTARCQNSHSNQRPQRLCRVGLIFAVQRQTCARHNTVFELRKRSACRHFRCMPTTAGPELTSEASNRSTP